jgi:hypothetical protein
VWSGSTWLRIGTGGGLLWMRWWTLGFWCQGVSWLLNHYNCPFCPTITVTSKIGKV